MNQVHFQKALNKIYPKYDIELLSFNMPKRTSHEVYFVEFKKDNKKRKLVFKFEPSDVPEYKSSNIEKEVYVINQLKKSKAVDVPNIIYNDFTKEIFPKDYFVMELVNGIPISECIKNSTLKNKIEYVKKTAELMANVHNLPIDLFDKLPKENYAESIIKRHLSLYKGLNDKKSNNLGQLEFELIEKSIKYLEQNKPIKSDNSLINGDFSPEHIIQTKNKKYTLLDWDPSEIGDRSWDIYWMIKEASEFVFGYKDSIKDLIKEYNKVSNNPLQNQEYYKNAAVTWAYLLGWYIEEKIPNSHLIGPIRHYRPHFSKRIENLI